MEKVLITKNKIDRLADKLREKLINNEPILLDEFPDEVEKVYVEGWKKGADELADYIMGEQDKIIAFQDSIINGTWDGKTIPEIKEFEGTYS
ncbi:MAG: hypothetical protein IJ949_02380 [Oscillospiraceae bacterium]|nr:hypothetical protein [Oscillospiraceae bacterium]